MPEVCHWDSEYLLNISVVSTAYLEGGFSWAQARAPEQRCPSPEHNRGGLISIKENLKLMEGRISILRNVILPYFRPTCYQEAVADYIF